MFDGDTQVFILNLVALVVVGTPACGKLGALFAADATVVGTVKGIFIVSAQHCVSSCCRVVCSTDMCAESTFEVWDKGWGLDICPKIAKPLEPGEIPFTAVDFVATITACIGYSRNSSKLSHAALSSHDRLGDVN